MERIEGEIETGNRRCPIQFMNSKPNVTFSYIFQFQGSGSSDHFGHACTHILDMFLLEKPRSYPHGFQRIEKRGRDLLDLSWI